MKIDYEAKLESLIETATKEGTEDMKNELLYIKKMIATHKSIVRLKKEPAVEVILKEIEQRIKAIDTELVNNETLTDRDRDRLFARKTEANSFLSMFSSSEAALKDFEERIKENI